MRFLDRVKQSLRLQQPPATKTSAAGPVIAWSCIGQPKWTPRRYDHIAEEGFRKNVVAYRCVMTIATACGSVPWLLYDDSNAEIDQHPLLDLLQHPNPLQDGVAFMESVYADLVILNVGINDWDAAVTAATYTTNVQALITAIKTGSSADILMMTPPPTNTTSASTTAQQNLITAMYSLAQSNNIPLVDIWARWQSYAVAQPLGFYADTFTHPNALGYSDLAQAIKNVLLGV